MVFYYTCLTLGLRADIEQTNACSKYIIFVGLQGDFIHCSIDVYTS